MRFALPLGLFILVVALFGVGLTRDPKLVPSPLIGKPAPDFRLDLLATPARALGIEDLRGQVFLLNVWASWCVACGTEHPLLVELAKSGTVDIIGLNYKDERSDALEWLSQRGDPYRLSLHDLAVLANYIITLRKEALALSRACGVPHPSLITSEHLEILDGRYNSSTVPELFGYEMNYGLPSPEDRREITAMMASSSPAKAN